MIGAKFFENYLVLMNSCCVKKGVNMSFKNMIEIEKGRGSRVSVGK